MSLIKMPAGDNKINRPEFNPEKNLKGPAAEACFDSRGRIFLNSHRVENF